MRTLLCRYGMAVCVMFSLLGCKTTYEAERTPAKELQREGSIVFVRPDRYSILGTRSIRDYIEIAYEQISVNEAGYPVLAVGLRNRGGQHFWDVKGPDVQLSVQTAFYDRPIQPDGAASGSAAYRTNWQTVKLVRGQTFDYTVACPVKGANHYQVTISEYLK
ncbi:MAG: hypothetical protein JXM79_17140 [Sedimentisphaerales bacterium]|nr:hypothetical protein [Sedimentisphaerales bacterium]